MTFHRLIDFSALPDDFVCREAHWPRALWSIILAGIGIGMLFIPAGGVARWFLFAMAALMLWVARMSGQLLIGTFGRQNWLIRIRSQSVWIKFRSFANAHFNAEDEVIVQLEPADIAWLGSLREHLITPGSESGETRSERITYLEIGLQRVDFAELERRLTEELNRKPPPAWVTTKLGDYPVRLVDESTLRIRWRGGSNYITPAVSRALAELSRFAEVREPSQLLTDTVTPTADRAEQESRILELVERGDTMGAIKLVRTQYGYSLTKAKQFVDGLAQSQADSLEGPTGIDSPKG